MADGHRSLSQLRDLSMEETPGLVSADVALEARPGPVTEQQRYSSRCGAGTRWRCGFEIRTPAQPARHATRTDMKQVCNRAFIQ